MIIRSKILGTKSSVPDKHVVPFISTRDKLLTRRQISSPPRPCFQTLVNRKPVSQVLAARTKSLPKKHCQKPQNHNDQSNKSYNSTNEVHVVVGCWIRRKGAGGRGRARGWGGAGGWGGIRSNTLPGHAPVLRTYRKNWAQRRQFWGLAVPDVKHYASLDQSRNEMLNALHFEQMNFFRIWKNFWK